MEKLLSQAKKGGGDFEVHRVKKTQDGYESLQKV